MSATIGVLCPGDPTAAGTWSGIPSGIIHSLEKLGLEVRSINVDAPQPISLGVSLIVGGQSSRMKWCNAPSSVRLVAQAALSSTTSSPFPSWMWESSIFTASSRAMLSAER